MLKLRPLLDEILTVKERDVVRPSTPPQVLQDSLDCRFCGSKALFKIEEVSRSVILAEYKKLFAVTFSPAILEKNFAFDSIGVYECSDCGTITFWPRIVGDAAFYSAIGTLPWYYAKDRWEYQRTLDIFHQSGIKTFLEIGCGSGQFLKLAQTHGYFGVGVDLNTDAVAQLKADGFEVFDNLNQAMENRIYDAVLMFQMLEHIPDPCAFVRPVLSHVQKGGLTLISSPVTPSCSSCVADDVFQLPPHHQWLPTAAAYQKLAQRLGCTCEAAWFDAPDPFQVEFGIRNHLGWMPGVDRYAPALGRIALRGATALNCDWTKVGHSILVALRVPGRPDPEIRPEMELPN